MKFFLFLFTPLACLFTGCASQYQGYGPHFSPPGEQIHRIAVISPDLYVYDVSGGGIPEFRIDWSKSAETNLGEALRMQLTKKGIEGIFISDVNDIPSLDTIMPFIKLVATVIHEHLYGKDPFTPQIDSFDYSAGPIAELCNHLQVDAVMFSFGADENFSPLRKETLNKIATVKTAKATFWGAISMILFGSGTFRSYTVPLEQTFVCCLVADKNGKIIWYKHYMQSDGADLRKSADAGKLAGNVLNGFYFRKK